MHYQEFEPKVPERNKLLTSATVFIVFPSVLKEQGVVPSNLALSFR